jgi:hypothetical protein
MNKKYIDIFNFCSVAEKKRKKKITLIHISSQKMENKKSKEPKRKTSKFQLSVCLFAEKGERK